MTTPRAEQPDRSEAIGADVPRTGDPAVDRALASLQGLESAPLSDHHDRLARVHEELHTALNADRSNPGT